MGAERDSMLRIALAAMAADPTSSLTIAQRRWIIDLAQRTRPLTPGERGKLKEPLAMWMQEKMPRCVDLLEQQYAEEGRA